MMYYNSLDEEEKRLYRRELLRRSRKRRLKRLGYRHHRRLSRRFESQRLAAASSGRGLTWLRSGAAAGQRRPSRRPRQLTGGRRRS